MLTSEQVKLYAKFDGDIDAWARAGGDGMSDEQWHRLDELVHKLLLVGSGEASPAMRSRVQSEVIAAVVDKHAQECLRSYVQQCA